MAEDGQGGGPRPGGAKGRPTLRTIAYMTGLGVTTVSRALNDAPDIGQATKERVRLVAGQIGYRPNRAGVRLRTGKTNVISLILSVETEVLGLTPHLVHGISERLAGTPYHLIVTPYDPRTDPLGPVRYIVETGSADGVIFSRIEPEDPRVRYLRERGFPFATHGRTAMDIVHPYFDFDNERYAEIAVRRLAARGRERLALLPPPANLTYCQHMSTGFARALDRLDLTEIPIREVTIDSAHEAIEAEVGRMMRSARRRPDGFVCGSASAAIAVISGAEAAGFEIGRDFDLAVKDSFHMMEKFRRQTVVIHEDFRAAGAFLADAVTRTLAGVPPGELQRIDVPPDA
ncbi:LacI family transcriptional regulator [Amaricoccus solimangrovi]|uniref:LacI family DNA-binding transcriptional regulator n=1 Tax=Amaricoccus solimangrovi TaxID=2589815 RepID=A0A501WMJ7_9RHOB|nr:LacI family transcriptional regulator [Amaricoccus solimangrovi]TPE49555.1 LacI family DNA-binding transcriptional regulator [Amaricoccus solimangrovi]